MATAALETPTTCWPSWHRTFAPLAQGTQVTVFSGCGLNAQGNIGCSPETMRANAEAQLKRLAPNMFSGKLSLEAYTLARYMQSEVGSGPIEERVAVGEAAVNRAKLEKLSRGVLSLLLYRQSPGHPNYGFYGPIHDTAEGCAARGLKEFCAPYTRWAATSKDPTVLTLLLADLIMSGRSGNFANGADNQVGLQYTKAFPDPAAYVRGKAANGDYWVGPLPGVNHWRTFLVKRVGVAPTSPLGATLLVRGLAAVSSREAPVWSANMPLCTTDGPPGPGGASSNGWKIAAGIAGVGAASWLALYIAKNLAQTTTLGRRRRSRR